MAILTSLTYSLAKQFLPWEVLVPFDINFLVKWHKQRAGEILANAKDGKLPRHALWELQYHKSPYLLLVDKTELEERFIDIFSNFSDLNEAGQITPRDDSDYRMMQIFQHFIAAQSGRGGISFDVIQSARNELLKYYRNGKPRGIRELSKFMGQPKDILVKYSKKKYLVDTLKFGVLKITPASHYSKGSLLKAMKDLETTRRYRIPAWQEAYNGMKFINIRGVDLPIEGGAVTLDISVRDYYLFCCCNQADLRLPTDFDADAALIIKDRQRFVRAIKSALASTHKGFNVHAGDVFYYDPFFPPHDRSDLEFLKHFSYRYQKEYRVVIKPPHDHREVIDEIFLEIGPIDDYSELVDLE
ncbi:MAG: hypothetical protein Q8S29_12830 [Phreatobacter sp.]|nr:hypothetical protein [Phreatobacter sp.]